MHGCAATAMDWLLVGWQVLALYQSLVQDGMPFSILSKSESVYEHIHAGCNQAAASAYSLPLGPGIDLLASPLTP